MIGPQIRVRKLSGDEVWRTGVDDVAVQHDSGPIGDPEDLVGELLDDENREPLGGDPAHVAVELFDDDRRQAHRKLVDEQQRGFGRERSCHRKHLLLAARHRARRLLAALAEPGELLEGSIEHAVVGHAGVRRHAQVAASKAKVEAAVARVQLAEVAVKQAELNLQRAVVRAPVAGIVSKKSVEPGQIIQPGQPLMTVIPLDRVWITANFKETQLRDMRVGLPVTVEVDAYGGREYKGKVESIAAATGSRFSLLPPDNATGNFVKVVQRVPVKIALDEGQDPEHLLRPGMSVTPTVHTK